MCLQLKGNCLVEGGWGEDVFVCVGIFLLRNLLGLRSIVVANP